MTKPDPRRRHSVTFSTPEEKTLVMRKLREKCAGWSQPA